MHSSPEAIPGFAARRHPSLLRRCALAGLLAGISLMTRAQAIDPELFPNLVGAGIGVTPDYTGADSRSAAVAPLLRYHFEDSRRAISIVGPIGSVNLIESPTLHGGPVFRYRFGRQDAKDPVVARMHEIDPTIDVGAYLSYWWTGSGGVPWRLRVAGNVLIGIDSDHAGTSGSLDAQFWLPVSQRVILGVGGALNYGSSSFMNTYYGVTAQDSVASGLPVFRPGSSSTSADAWVGVMYLLKPNWVVGAGVYYQRLTGDAADSPIVRDRGNADQISGGVGAAYYWQ